MRNRSWMAARAMIACLALAAVGPARAQQGEGDDDTPPAPIRNTVKLDIQISGLGPKGAKVEIKPAHPGCKFKAEKKTIARTAQGEVSKIEPFAVVATSTSPDRDCSFEIIVTEPGREPRTFRRGLQLTSETPGAASPARTLKCYLPASTIAAKDAEKTGRTKR